MQDNDKKAGFKELLEQLHDPLKLRLLVTGIMLAVGYLGIYMPLSGHIDETTRELNRSRKRQTLGNEIEQLRAEVGKFQARLPEDTDSNEWMQYVLGGIRKFPAKLISLNLGDPQRVGPYAVVVFKIELEGEFHELDLFLQWLESNPRIFRVDSAKITPARRSEGLVMQLTVLGMKG